MDYFMVQSDSDYIETVDKAMRSYNLMSIIIIAVIAGVILALICTFYFEHKKGEKPMRKIKTFEKFKSAQGVITDMEEETYFVKPYVHEPVHITDENKKNKNKLFSAIEKQLEEETVKEQSQPIEKKRIKVSYIFAAEEFGEGFCGEFYIYKKIDDVDKGNHIDVMYDPEHPQVNFTKYNRPI